MYSSPALLGLRQEVTKQWGKYHLEFASLSSWRFWKVDCFKAARRRVVKVVSSTPLGMLTLITLGKVFDFPRVMFFVCSYVQDWVQTCRKYHINNGSRMLLKFYWGKEFCTCWQKHLKMPFPSYFDFWYPESWHWAVHMQTNKPSFRHLFTQTGHLRLLEIEKPDLS